MENTKKLLNIKYGLEIIEEYPILKVKEIWFPYLLFFKKFIYTYT
jgi:hypothetical protein